MHALSGDSVHILQVTAQVTALGKSFLAEGALEGTQACVLAEVIAQIAALLENAATLGVLALEVQLHALSLGVLHADSLMPLFGNALKSFVFVSS